MKIQTTMKGLLNDSQRGFNEKLGNNALTVAARVRQTANIRLSKTAASTRGIASEINY